MGGVVVVVAHNPTPDLQRTGERPLVTVRSVAGGVAAVVAWRTGSMTATIVVGMAVLWGVEWAVG
jgi:branched-subunit amino acid transport protein